RTWGGQHFFNGTNFQEISHRKIRLAVAMPVHERERKGNTCKRCDNITPCQKVAHTALT
ncbi:unnamed protein product, partial [Dovyalis caffra]